MLENADLCARDTHIKKHAHGCVYMREEILCETIIDLQSQNVNMVSYDIWVLGVLSMGIIYMLS